MVADDVGVPEMELAILECSRHGDGHCGRLRDRSAGTSARLGTRRIDGPRRLAVHDAERDGPVLLGGAAAALEGRQVRRSDRALPGGARGELLAVVLEVPLDDLAQSVDEVAVDAARDRQVDARLATDHHRVGRAAAFHGVLTESQEMPELAGHDPCRCVDWDRAVAVLLQRTRSVNGESDTRLRRLTPETRT